MNQKPRNSGTQQPSNPTSGNQAAITPARVHSNPMMDCPLCRLVSAPENDPLFLVANDDAVAVLHDDWAVRGHAMVVARRHVENSSELTAGEASVFFETVRELEHALLSALPVERVFLMKLGIAVPHLHLHLYPMSAAAIRDDFLRAVTMQSRDEPAEEEKRRLVATLRRDLRKR